MSLWAALLLLPSLGHSDTILSSVHNLSAAGPGTIKATAESDVCIFCHTAHKSNGATPLWNHSMSTVSNYIVYSSTNLTAMGLTIPQPNGSSRLCLSCHDGTVALGNVSTRTTPITMQQNGAAITTMPGGTSNLGTDLSGDHPISFVYDQSVSSKDPQIKDPSTLTGKVKLDENNRLQCTACHDPHNNQFGKFLVMDNTGSALCMQCHNIADWSGSAHAMASQLVPSTLPEPASVAKTKPLVTAGAARPKTTTTVADSGCASCHTSHTAEGKQHLMKFASPEQNCLPCHSGAKPGIKDVGSDFKKVSIHPIMRNAASHSPLENLINPATRHVTCADCHNPHATAAATASTTKVAVTRQKNKARGPLADVAGVSATGATLQRVDNEYELCFRCHADSLNRGAATVRRQVPETNKRLQFATVNASYHPVEASGKNPNVPSLVPPWTISSTMSCIDCHNNDQSPGNGGSGANGPHGSTFAPLLERQLVTTDNGPETPANYALCYKCHDRQSILGDRSFRAVNSLGQDRGHRFHIVDQKTACTTCHDSHGVQSSRALINFNKDYVTPSSNGRIEYVSTGNLSGNCSLSCHGKDHDGSSYPNLSPSILKSRSIRK